MRIAMITSAAALLIVGASNAPAAWHGNNGTSATVAAVSAPVTPNLLAVQDTQTAKGEVKVNVTETRTTTWYTDPVWITVGVVALLVIVLLVALAARGNGSSTTVVR